MYPNKHSHYVMYYIACKCFTLCKVFFFLFQSFLNYGHTSAIFLVITYIIAVLLVGAALQTAGVKPLSLHKLFLSKCSSS